MGLVNCSHVCPLHFHNVHDDFTAKAAALNLKRRMSIAQPGLLPSHPVTHMPNQLKASKPPVNLHSQGCRMHSPSNTLTTELHPEALMPPVSCATRAAPLTPMELVQLGLTCF